MVCDCTAHQVLLCACRLYSILLRMLPICNLHSATAVFSLWLSWVHKASATHSYPVWYPFLFLSHQELVFIFISLMGPVRQLSFTHKKWEVHWHVQWWWWWSVYEGIWVVSWKNGTSPSSFNYAHLLMAFIFISYIEILISLFLWICLFYTINIIKFYTILYFLIAFILLVYMFVKFAHCLSMIKEHSGEKI